MMRRIVAVLFLLIAALRLSATTQIDFTLDDLIRKAEHVVRATVAHKECNSQSCRYTLKINETLDDSRPDAEMVLEQATFFEGAPELAAGEEYVLFLRPSNRLERVLGMQLGTLRVRERHVFDYWHRPVVLSQDRVRHSPAIRAQDASHLTLDDLRGTIREKYRRRMR